MLYAGVAWDERGYVVASFAGEGAAQRPEVRYPAGQTAELIEQLRLLAGREQLAVVVESTCGILDGRMMAAGLPVYRADPGLLPERPVFGSVPAAAIARAAGAFPGALTRLVRDRGTQTGREGELEGCYAVSADALSAMVAAGTAIEHGPRAGAEVALTFDDGPNPPYTDRVLDVLERYGVPATFFCVGMNALAYPELLVRMRGQGHELGNHTWSHPFLQELTAAELSEQLRRAGESIAAAAGGEAPGLFRPPYGSRTPAVLDRLARSGSTTVLWDNAPDDWKMPGAHTIADRVLARLAPGSIVLLHDGGGDRGQTVAALPAIIEDAQAAGLRFTTVSALTMAGV
jgi:peptidoglycan/xylan/chitin deacetylase (PgdA/CDA1 family)